MKTNRKLRFQLFVQNSFFVVLFLVLVFLLGFLSYQYHAGRDVTQGGRNTLTEGSANVLKQMQGPINITAYVVKDNDTRKYINKFVERYQRVKPDISLSFVSPTEEPKATQEAGVKAEIELVVEYNKRSEHIIPPQAFIEQDMTNLLVRLSRTNQNAIMFLDGHGERSLIGIKNHDIGDFGKHLENKGFKLANPDLLIAQAVPNNGAMLVIASPQVDVTEVEVKKIRDYLDAGGNLLWLIDDETNLHGLQPIAEYLGIQLTPGMVVDLSAKRYGADAKVAFANQYGEHAITKNFMLRTLFPEARMVHAEGSYDNGWKVSNLVEVAPNGWLETGKVDDNVSFDNKKDLPGPINIAVALDRKYGDKGQRVVVVGNGNFLSNTFLNNGGNLDLGVNIVNWLAGDDKLITIQPKPLKDVNIQIPGQGWASLLAQFVFLGFSRVLPVALIVIGMVIWWRRRKA